MPTCQRVSYVPFDAESTNYYPTLFNQNIQRFAKVISDLERANLTDQMPSGMSVTMAGDEIEAKSFFG